MFDIGWTEMLVVAMVAILVVGPKDLPKMLRAFGKTVGNLRKMAGDFQRTFNDAIDEAELDEVKNLSKSSEFAPLSDAKKSMEDFTKQVKDSMNDTTKDIGNDIGGELDMSDEIEAPAVEPPATPTPPKKTAAKKTAPKKPAVKKAASKTTSRKPAAKVQTKKPAAKTAANTKPRATSKSASKKSAAKPKQAEGAKA